MTRPRCSRTASLASSLIALALSAGCNSPDAVFGSGASGGEASTDAGAGGSGASDPTGGSGGTTGTGGAGAGEPLPVFETLWAHRYAAAEDQRASAIAARSSGAMLAASLRGTVTLGGMDYTAIGNADVMLVTIEPVLGDVTGVNVQGDASLQEALALAVSPQNDDAAIGGSYSGSLWNQQADGTDAFTVLVRPDNSMWINRRQTNQILGTTFDDTNRVVSVGDFEGTIDTPDPDLTSAGGLDACVYWFNNNGNVQSAAKLGSDAQDSFAAVATDASGNVYAVGHAGGELLEDVAEPYGGGTDVLLASWDELAALRFVRLFGDAAAQSALDVAVDPSSGEIVVVGVFEGKLTFGEDELESTEGEDGFIAKFTSEGEPVFARAFGGPSAQRAQSVAVDGTGRIIVAGDFEVRLDLGEHSLNSAGKSDIFIAAFDEDGNAVTLQGIGDDASQYAEDIATDAGDHVYVAASVQGDVDFGTGVLESVDTSFDIVVARLAP